MTQYRGRGNTVLGTEQRSLPLLGRGRHFPRDSNGLFSVRSRAATDGIDSPEGVTDLWRSVTRGKVRRTPRKGEFQTGNTEANKQKQRTPNVRSNNDDAQQRLTTRRARVRTQMNQEGIWKLTQWFSEHWMPTQGSSRMQPSNSRQGQHLLRSEPSGQHTRKGKSRTVKCAEANAEGREGGSSWGGENLAG